MCVHERLESSAEFAGGQQSVLQGRSRESHATGTGMNSTRGFRGLRTALLPHRRRGAKTPEAPRFHLRGRRRPAGDGAASSPPGKPAQHHLRREAYSYDSLAALQLYG